MIKPSMYQKVNKLKEIGYTVSAIVSTTGLDIKTVKKYLSMNSEEFQVYYSNLKQRTKRFDPYLDEVLEIIGYATFFL